MTEFIKEDSLTESTEMLSHAYSQRPLNLSDLNKTDVLEMAKELTYSINGKWTEKTERKFIDWMNRDRRICRPLYVMIFVEFPNADDPVELVRSVLKKEEARRIKQINTDEIAIFENLLFLSTVVGSIKTKDGDFDHLTNKVTGNLLPNLDILDFNQYFEISSSFDETESIPGLRPDLLGELFVLDNLDIDGIKGIRYQKLLKIGYEIQPDDVIGFVMRCYQDFSGHPGFHKLFNMPVSSKESRVTKAKLVAHIACFPSIIYDDFLKNELANLTKLADSYSEESELIKWISMSEYNYACTLMFTNKYPPFIQALLGINRNERINLAKEKFSSVISRLGETSRIRIMALINLAILFESDNTDESIRMYTEVIESMFSEDETRACALNNRASIYQKKKDYESSIIDREKVLELSNTSADRRFVALFGWGESNYSLGLYDKVVQGMTKIIETKDIKETDKLCALIIRAVSYFFMEATDTKAIKDLINANYILLKYVSNQELKIKLESLIKECDPNDWGKAIIFLESLEENQNDWAIDLLLRIVSLLAGDHKTDTKIEIEKWSDLRNLTMSKANRIRIAIPEIK